MSLTQVAIEEILFYPDLADPDDVVALATEVIALRDQISDSSKAFPRVSIQEHNTMPDYPFEGSILEITLSPSPSYDLFVEYNGWTYEFRGTTYSGRKHSND